MAPSNLEERTIGFVLRAPLYDGATYSNCFSAELIQFLDKPEDLELIQKMPCSEMICAPKDEPYLDFKKRNPFVGTYCYGTMKHLLNRAAKQEFSVVKGLLESTLAPHHTTGLPTVESREIDSYSLAKIFQQYHILAEKLGIQAEVRTRICQYIDVFTSVIEKEIHMHITEKVPFELKGHDKEMIERYENSDIAFAQEFAKDCRETYQENLTMFLLNDHTNLVLLKKVQDLDFCKKPTDAEPKTSLLLVSLSSADEHIISTIAELTPEALKTYVEKYGFNFDESFNPGFKTKKE